MLKQLITLVSLVCLLVSPKAFAAGYNSGPTTYESVIDGATAKSLSSVQAQLQNDLRFPGPYDGTFKSLSAGLIDGPHTYFSIMRNIRIVNPAHLRHVLGGQVYRTLIMTMTDAATANTNFHFYMNVED